MSCLPPSKHTLIQEQYLQAYTYYPVLDGTPYLPLSFFAPCSGIPQNPSQTGYTPFSPTYTASGYSFSAFTTSLGPEDTSSYFTPSTTDASPSTTTSSGASSATSLPATQPTGTTASATTSTNSPTTSTQITSSVIQKSGAGKETCTLYRCDTADYRCLDWFGCLHIGMLVANPFGMTRWISGNVGLVLRIQRENYNLCLR